MKQRLKVIKKKLPEAAEQMKARDVGQLRATSRVHS